MPGKPVKIDVIIEEDTPDMKFRLESTDIPIGPDNHPYFKNCDVMGFDITFTLKDPNNLGYRFPDMDADAIWSAVGTGCPHSEAWEIFKSPKVLGAGKMLKVENANTVAANFAFTMNVSKSGQKPYRELDPGGTNQNGSVRQNIGKDVLLAVGGVVAGSLLTLSAQALLQG